MLSTPQRRSTRRSALAKKDHTVQTPRQSTGQTDDGGYMSSSSLSSLESEPDSGTDDYIDTNSPLGAKATGDKSRRGTKARSRTHRQGNGNSSAQAKSRGGRKSGSTKPVSLWDVSSVPGTTKSGLLGKARLLHTTKRRRLSANAAEPTEEESHDEEGALHEHDSALFDAILDEDTALDAIVSDWIDSFSEDSSAAFQELLGLFLRASGCPFTIEQVEFDDEDSAVRVLNALQTKLKSEALPDFPMQSRARQYKKFSNHCLDFVTRLLKQGQHVLVFSGPFTDMLSLWLTFMSSSSFRPFRYTATLVALKVISVLCELHQTLQTNLSTSHRQLQSEQKKRRRSSATSGSQDRMRQLEENVQTFTQQKTELEQQLDKWFELIFNHRYRDKDAHIRQHCVQALAEWISTLPTRFLEDKYLRFLGWVMSDKATVVRQTALVELQGLYSQSTLIPGLTHFTTRFVGRIVHMALYDADITGVRVAAMELLTTLCKYGLVDHALRGFTENQAIRDDTTTDSPDTTLDDIALNVLRRFHIVLNAEGEATATETICICENMTDGEHRKECYEAQLVGHLLVQNPLQAYVIPHLFHPHSGIRQATASLVAWWISHQWTPALLGFEKATEMDPLGLEAAEMESSEETSASDEDTDEEEEEKDHLSSWDLHSALTLKQKRHFCTYKAVVALLDVFTYTSRLNSVPPDNTLSISLEMIRMEDAMGTRSVTSALDVQVCAATSALATQLPELMHWRALCTYMAIDHTLSGSDALDIVGQLAETTLASPTRSNRRTGTPKQRRQPTRQGRRTNSGRNTTAQPVNIPHHRYFYLSDGQETIMVDVFVESLKAICWLPDTATMIESAGEGTTLPGHSGSGHPPTNPSAALAAATTTPTTGSRPTARDRKRMAQLQQKRHAESVSQLNQYLITLLPRLLTRYRANGHHHIAKLLCIITDGILNLTTYLDMRQMSQLDALMSNLKDLYLGFQSPVVINQALGALCCVVRGNLLQSDHQTNRVTDQDETWDGDASEADADARFTQRLAEDPTFTELVNQTSQQVLRICSQLRGVEPTHALSVTFTVSDDTSNLDDLEMALYRLLQLARLCNLQLTRVEPMEIDAGATYQLPGLDGLDLGALIPVLLELFAWHESLPEKNVSPASAINRALALRIISQQLLWLVHEAVAESPKGTVEETTDVPPEGSSPGLAILKFVKRYLMEQGTLWLSSSSDVVPRGVPLLIVQHEMFQALCHTLWLFSSDITHPRLYPGLAQLRETHTGDLQSTMSQFMRGVLDHWLDVTDSQLGVTPRTHALGARSRGKQGTKVRFNSIDQVVAGSHSNDEVAAWSELPGSDMIPRLMDLARRNVGNYLRCITMRLFNVESLTPLVAHFGLLDPVYDDLVKTACEQLLQFAPPVDSITLHQYYQLLRFRQKVIDVCGVGVIDSYELWMNRCRHLDNPTVGLTRTLAQLLRTMLNYHPTLPAVSTTNELEGDATPTRTKSTVPTPTQQLHQLYRVVSSSVFKLHQNGQSYVISKLKGFLRLENHEAGQLILKFFKALVPITTGLVSVFQAKNLQRHLEETLEKHDITPVLLVQMVNEGNTASNVFTAKDWDPYHQYVKQLQRVLDKKPVARLATPSGGVPPRSGMAVVGTPSALASPLDGARKNLKRQLDRAQTEDGPESDNQAPPSEPAEDEEDDEEDEEHVQEDAELDSEADDKEMATD